jgi:hypothetical protein
MRNHENASCRPAFALLSVLITLVGASALAALLLADVHEAISAANNRVLLRQGAFVAEGCAAERLSVLHDALQVGEPTASRAWQAADSLIAEQVGASDECKCVETPFGAKLNVNAATEAQLRALLVAYEIDGLRADSLIDALADWRDSDDLARPLGAERAWYREHGRVGPRNGPLANVLELALIRGFGAPDVPLAALATEGEQLLAARASDRAVGAVEGVAPEEVKALRKAKGMVLRTEDLRALTHRADAATPASYEGPVKPYGIGDEMSGWTVECTAAVGQPSVSSTATVRIARSGRRVALIGQEITP